MVNHCILNLIYKHSMIQADTLYDNSCMMIKPTVLALIFSQQ